MHSALNSALYAGHVMHQRLRPLKHRLQYRVFSLLLDVDELPTLQARLRWFSVGRFNLFSLRPSDYGDGCADGLRAYVDGQLTAAGLQAGGAIRLLTMPRILGYAFNPLSVYFCHHPQGPLQAMLYEVRNTFGERHSYLIPVDPVHPTDPAAPKPQAFTQRCDKRMFVSPFLDMQMHYRFRIHAPQYGGAAWGSRLGVGVDAHDAQGAVLVAQLDAVRRPLTDGALLRALVTYPLLTLTVVAAIHWEALKLLLRGVGLHLKHRPAAPTDTVSVIPHRAKP